MRGIRGNGGRRALVCYGFAALSLLSACTTFDAIHPSQPRYPSAALDKRELEVHFAKPMELVGERPGGERVTRSRVRRVMGRPLALRNDSLTLEVHKWDTDIDSRRESRPFVAIIPNVHGCAEVGTRRYSGGRTGAAILSVPVGLWVLLFIMCELGQCPIPST